MAFNQTGEENGAMRQYTVKIDGIEIGSRKSAREYVAAVVADGAVLSYHGVQQIAQVA
jgi:hypothetical protein